MHQCFLSPQVIPKRTQGWGWLFLGHAASLGHTVTGESMWGPATHFSASTVACWAQLSGEPKGVIHPQQVWELAGAYVCFQCLSEMFISFWQNASKYHTTKKILNRPDERGPGRADSLPRSGTWITLPSQNSPIKGALLPVRGGGGWFSQCHLSSAQQASEGHWGQKEKVGFPEEPDFPILWIQTGPEKPQPLSSDEWHLQRWVLISQLVQVEKKHICNPALRTSCPMSSKAYPKGWSCSPCGFPECHWAMSPLTWVRWRGKWFTLKVGSPTFLLACP